MPKVSYILPMSDEGRPPILSEMKRQIRQRCHFGCVMCGSPVFDYEHMTGYVVTGHVADDITLLCPMHHREKTAGRLPTSLVRKADAFPYNSPREYGARHPTYFDAETLRVELGNVHFTAALHEGKKIAAIVVDDEPVVSVRREDDTLLISAILRDEDNNILVSIKDGELVHTVKHWDVEFVGKTLTIRRALWKPSLVIRFEPDRFVIERASIWSRGVHLKIGKATKEGGIRIENVESDLSGFTVEDATVGLWICDDVTHPPQGCLFAWKVSNRWHGGWTGDDAFYRA